MNVIAGVDEVGRGCLSGPVVSAAVVFDETVFIPHLKESKSISPERRKVLFKDIMKLATSVGLSVISVKHINQFGLHRSCQISAAYAVEKLSIKPELVIIDGFYNPYITEVKQYPIEKADEKSAVVAAASIVAKVVRDSIMRIYHNVIPEYDFFNNKGYPTKKHVDSIVKFGLSELHRYFAYKFIVHE
ncbi:MAG: ribonuclease HII [Elusimicrobiota bacterium]|nr:ribonuclease HII [Elusimicrobiota bacterium]